MHLRRPRHPAAPAPWLVVFGLLAAACSRGGGSAEAPAPQPSGPPVVLGMVNQENAPVGSFPEVREGAEAAVAYLNRERGGVGGRPLKLEVCTTTGSPESSQACALQLLEKHPVAVVGGVDLGASSSLPVLAKAGIPYVGGSPTLAAELTSSNAYMLSGGTPADLLGQVSYIVDTLHPTSVAILYVDLGGLLSVVGRVGEDILHKKGVAEVKLVTERADAADFTTAVTAANSGRPDVILAVFPAQACARIMQAKQALGVKAKMFYPSACADQGVVDAAGAGAAGAYFAAGYLPYTGKTEKNVAIYLASIGATGGAGPSLLSETGFSVVVDLATILGQVSGPLTPATATARIAGTKDQQSFLGHSFTCDGRQVALLTSVCNIHVRMLQQRDGRFDDVVGDWVSGEDLLELVTG